MILIAASTGRKTDVQEATRPSALREHEPRVSRLCARDHFRQGNAGWLARPRTYGPPVRPVFMDGKYWNPHKPQPRVEKRRNGSPRGYATTSGRHARSSATVDESTVRWSGAAAGAPCVPNLTGGPVELPRIVDEGRDAVYRWIDDCPLASGSRAESHQVGAYPDFLK
jgi:hypothetical protein